MKQQVRVLIFAAVATGLFGQALSAQEQKGPQIGIKEAAYDFGKVVEGTKLQHVFEVGNTGDAALEIQRVQPS